MFGTREEQLSKLKKLYSEKYFSDEELNLKRKIMYQQEITEIKKYINYTTKKYRILDVGCGTGDFLSLFDNNFEKFGIEISDYAIKEALKKNIKIGFKHEDNFFDIIVFRGTIQHLPNPIQIIQESYFWLKKNGSLIFLSTPITNSIIYKLFFLLPSDKMFNQILLNFGFSNIIFKYPYFKTPYARPLSDVISFFVYLVKPKKNKISFPFYRNMMECYATKE